MKISFVMKREHYESNEKIISVMITGHYRLFTKNYITEIIEWARTAI